MLLVLASCPNRLIFQHQTHRSKTNVHESADSVQKKKKKKIADQFPGTFETFDAVLIYPQAGCLAFAKNMAYIFRGDSYVKWNLGLATDKFCSGPRKIASGFSELKALEAESNKD